MKIEMEEALKNISQSGELFVELFRHGTLSVEIYKPNKVDHQKPHDRDEIYVIATGEGEFYNDGKQSSFKKGDFLFVKAGKEHYFQNFTEDFSTWVFFYGPIGGE